MTVPRVDSAANSWWPWEMALTTAEDRPWLVEQSRHLVLALGEHKVLGVLGRVVEVVGQEEAFVGELRRTVRHTDWYETGS